MTTTAGDPAWEAALRFYASRSVLITGGASFIGSHLVELLLKAGAHLTVLDDLSSGKLENLGSMAKDVNFVQGDVRSQDKVEAAAAGCEVMFHLANAHGGRGYIDTHPVECVNNLICDHAAFAAAAAVGCGRIIYAGSACAYPVSLQTDATATNLLEESEAGFEVQGRAFPDGEYGWAKLMGELQLRAFHRQFGIDTVACRIFTAYGPRENESHAVIALVAKALARMDPYPIWGDGSQTRNFTYVKDTVTGMALAGARLNGCQAINIGTDEHISIDELIEEIFGILSWHPSEIKREIDMPVGVMRRAASLKKCRSELDWTPSWNLHDGLKETISWYESHTDAKQLAGLDKLLLSR